MQHSTREDQRGWYAHSGKPRNKLNKSPSLGQGRQGTLGRRLSLSIERGYRTNKPKPIVKVVAEVPAKRAKLAAGAEYGETWATKQAAHLDGKTTTTYHLDGVAYPSWEAWNEAVLSKAG